MLSGCCCPPKTTKALGAILILLATCSFFADPAEARLIKSWGLLGGSSSSTQEFDPVPWFLVYQERMPRWHVGVYVEWLDVPYFSIVTQINYARRGFKSRYLHVHPWGPPSVSPDVDRHEANYISLAFLVKLRPFDEIITPYVLGGPRVDLPRKPTGKRHFAYVYRNLNDAVFGFSAGGGVQTYRLLPVRIFVEFRYNWDISEAYNGSIYYVSQYYGWVSSGPVIIKNSSYDISIGFGF